MGNVCEQLHRLFNETERFSYPYDDTKIPLDVIYVMFESAEQAHGLDRIVHVGTHRGTKRLALRLQEHYVNENKDRSILRGHIGRAILNRTQDPFLKYWELNLTERKVREQYQDQIDFSKQRSIERQVTQHIRENMTFSVFQVDDKGKRSELEKGLLSTFSRCPHCRPSSTWLGLHSPVQRIQDSGLWNVQNLYGEPLRQECFEGLKRLVLRP